VLLTAAVRRPLRPSSGGELLGCVGSSAIVNELAAPSIETESGRSRSDLCRTLIADEPTTLAPADAWVTAIVCALGEALPEIDPIPRAEAPGGDEEVAAATTVLTGATVPSRRAIPQSRDCSTRMSPNREWPGAGGRCGHRGIGGAGEIALANASGALTGPQRSGEPEAVARSSGTQRLVVDGGLLVLELCQRHLVDLQVALMICSVLRPDSIPVKLTGAV